MSNYRPYIPEDKDLDPDWLTSLAERGERRVYAGDELKYIAMPCGGVGAGQLEICGNGKLGAWWIFNQSPPTNGGLGYSTGGRYLNPAEPDQPIGHGFRIRVEAPGCDAIECNLDGDACELSFVGEFPIAELSYHRDDLPVEIRCEVFSPFIPLNLRDSANPATIFRFVVRNDTEAELSVGLSGLLQNAVFHQMREVDENGEEVHTPGAGRLKPPKPVPSGCRRTNRVVRSGDCTSVLLGCEATDENARLHPQYGSMAISALAPRAWASADASDGRRPASAESLLGDNLCGEVGSSARLAPGEERAFAFVVSWYFPNLENHEDGCPGWVGRIYNNWYEDAAEVARYLAEHLDRLCAQTRAFRDTLFGSSLPRWLLHRISVPLTNLAAENLAIWQNGRLYAYEGVNFCLGTCGHVYSFVVAIARLFPELERSVRLMQDLALAYDPASGRVNFRGADGRDPEHDWAYASDAQSGYVLKLYREHQMSPDGSFLDEVWPKVKRIIGYLIFHDGATRGVEPNGVLEDLQTFWDPMWFGPNPYNNTLYLAALRAAEEMAGLQGETALAERYHAIFESGRAWMNERMWNGECYVHLYPLGFNHPGRGWCARDVITPQDDQLNARDYIDAMLAGKPHYFKSTACDAQQLFGQNWAHQLGLGYILPPENCRKAARSIFRYNWTPNIDLVYDLYPPKHRTLAGPGEPGLVNGAWPHEERQEFENIHDKDDIWTGLEYEAACDMITEGALEEAFIVLHSIHERYTAAKRNPWNEIEGAEHYSRAMHSWNILLTLSGFQYDGPAGAIQFAPRLNADTFRCFFSAAEGWGVFSQRSSAATQQETIEVKWGRLTLKTLAFELPEGRKARLVTVTAAGTNVRLAFSQEGKRVQVELPEKSVINTDSPMEITIEM